MKEGGWWEQRLFKLVALRRHKLSKDRRNEMVFIQGGENAVWVALPTIPVQMRDAGVSVLSCYVRIPKQAVQNKHSQPHDIAVVFQIYEFSINRLRRNQS